MALITAMLIVAIVAIVAAYLATSQQLWLRQTQNITDRAQAEALRSGALDWVAAFLARDGSKGNADHLGEDWARTLPPLPTEVGMISVAVADAQGRFNLNSLLRNGAPSQADIAAFQRLLRARRLDPTLTEALIDWIDADAQTRPGGAEDTDYLTLSHPYRAANQLLQSVDELRLVRGFDVRTVAALKPLVVALPEPTPVNLNTAPEEVLAALFVDAPDGALKQWVQARELAPLTDIGQLSSRLPPGIAPPQAAHSVNTSYFLVTITIQTGRLQRRSEALIKRPAGTKSAELIWQRQVYPEPTTQDERGESAGQTEETGR